MSNGSPLAMDACHRSSTFESTAGSWTRCQPHPSICSGVVPVYSYQRRLYQKMCPSGRAIHANCGIVSAIRRNFSSLCPSASSARRRAVMSSWTSTTSRTRPASSLSG